MSNISFSVFNLLEKSWVKFQENWLFFTCISVTFLFISMGLYMFSFSIIFPELSEIVLSGDQLQLEEWIINNHNTSMFLIKSFCLSCIILWFLLGFLQIALDATNNLNLDLSKLFIIDLNKFLIVVGGQFIIAFFFFLVDKTFLLFELPGFFSLLYSIGYFYLMIRFSFFIFVVLDVGRSISIVQALSNSWEMTQNKVFELASIYLLLFILCFMGIWLFLIGFFVALVVSALCLAYMYHDFKQS